MKQRDKHNDCFILKSTWKASLGETAVNSFLYRRKVPPHWQVDSLRFSKGGGHAAHTYASNLLSGRKEEIRLDRLCKYQKPKTQQKKNERHRRQNRKYQEDVILDTYEFSQDHVLESIRLFYKNNRKREEAVENIRTGYRSTQGPEGMERGPRQQITFLEEEGVSKERKALRKNKTRQDKTGVCTSF